MSAVGAAHVSLGFASLVLGAGIFSLRKGTDLHRVVGILYVLSMFSLNLTALLIYKLFGGFGVFHVLALISLTMVLSGLFTVLLKRPRKKWLRNHYFLMGWSYVGLWAAFGTEFTVRVVHWPLVAAVVVPTVGIVFIGGGVVQLREQHTMKSLRRTGV